MLLKVEKAMSGQKVCKGESMKTRISKGMIRESYEHLAKLGVCEFFKIFRTKVECAGAFSVASDSEELRKALHASGWMRLMKLSRTAATKLGADRGFETAVSVCLGSGGWRVLRRLRGCVAAHRPSRGAELTCSLGVSPKSAQTPDFSYVFSNFGLRRERLSQKKSMHECENQQGASLGRVLVEVVIRAD